MSMDSFQRCVEDLETIGRMLELPHGRDIAVEMHRELGPYLKELSALVQRDPTGGVKCILDHAEWLRVQLHGSESRELKSPRPRSTRHVA